MAECTLRYSFRDLNAKIEYLLPDWLIGLMQTTGVSVRFGKSRIDMLLTMRKF